MTVLAGSGMVTGGRVLHHLETVAPDHRNTILLAGFRAAGTRGEGLAHGARDMKMVGIVHGEPSAADTFGRRLRDELGRDATVAVHGETVPVATRPAVPV